MMMRRRRRSADEEEGMVMMRRRRKIANPRKGSGLPPWPGGGPEMTRLGGDPRTLGWATRRSPAADLGPRSAAF